MNGSQGKEGGQGSPILGATAAGEGAKEVRDEAPADDAVFMDDRNHDGVTSSNSQDEEIPGSTKGAWALPGPPGRQQLRHKFTEFQLQELERFFERNHYPSAEAR